MKSPILIAALLLSPLPALANSYVFFSGLCIENNRIVRVIGSACLTDAAAHADFEQAVAKRGPLCKESLTRVSDHRFGVSRPPLRADGCGPDVP